jgi:peptidoglycan/xylan/chitin deacetylase (PgdA/CDA1 family)
MIGLIRLSQSARRRLRRLYVRFLYLSGLLWWARSRIARDGVVVLTLHRVLPAPEFDRADCQQGMMVRDTTFDGLLGYLRDRCECVSLAKAGNAGSRAKVRVALTFDDGWRDNYSTALPLARKHEVPFTVFICPGFIEHRESFWPAAVVRLWKAAARSGRLQQLHALWRASVPGASGERDTLDDLMNDLKLIERTRRDAFIAAAGSLGGNGHFPELVEDGGDFLTWEQIREMAEQGVSFGSHTDSHRILAKIPADEALREMQLSKAAVEAKLKSCSLLAYPNGDWSETTRTLAAQCGYRWAFANSPGVWRAETNPFSIPRVNIWEGKLAGDDGKFSRLEFEYAVFWKAYRS